MNKAIIALLLAGAACIGIGAVIGASIFDKKRTIRVNADDDDDDDDFDIDVKIDTDAMDISSSAAVQNNNVDDTELKEENK